MNLHLVSIGAMTVGSVILKKRYVFFLLHLVLLCLVLSVFIHSVEVFAIFMWALDVVELSV